MTEWEADALGAAEMRRLTRKNEARVALADFATGALPDPYDGRGRLVTAGAQPRSGWFVFVFFGWVPWVLFRRRTATEGKVWMLPPQAHKQRVLTAAPIAVWSLGYLGFVGGLFAESVPVFVGGLMLLVLGMPVAAYTFARSVRGRIEDHGHWVRLLHLDPVAVERWNRRD